MRILTAIFAAFLVLAASPLALAEHPTEHPGQVQESADPEIDSTTTTGLDESWSQESKPGKTMAEFVDEGVHGKDRQFTDDEAMTLMRASRIVKEKDRKLATDVERIAAKISNL